MSKSTRGLAAPFRAGFSVTRGLKSCDFGIIPTMPLHWRRHWRAAEARSRSDVVYCARIPIGLEESTGGQGFRG